MEHQHFKISVIIPCLNEAENLTILLPYLIEHGFDKLDIIVIDGGSHDNTIEIAAQFGARIIETNTGHRALQLNKGAEAAREDILFFVHADVIPPKTFLKDILMHLRKGYKAGWFSYVFDNSSGLLKINEWFTGRRGMFSGGGDQCIFAVKSKFFELGGYDEKLVIMEDFDFTRKLKKNKVKSVVIRKDCTVSSRKYIRNSWLKVNFANLLAFSMFLFGFESLKIKKVYSGILK